MGFRLSSWIKAGVREDPDRPGRTEESPPIGREARAATLYSVGSARDPDHEAADALRQRSSEAADPFSVRHAGHALTRAPPPRIDIACQKHPRWSFGGPFLTAKTTVF